MTGGPYYDAVPMGEPRARVVCDRTMLVSVDVSYGEREVTTACVGFNEWADVEPSFEKVFRTLGKPAPYTPGEFYLRELPYLLGALAALTAQPKTIIIDGYVWLAKDKPGLGAKLHEQLGGKTQVIGVAKRPFRGNDAALAVYRGKSARPLYVTTSGIDVMSAAGNIVRMSGSHRVPAMLQRVDRRSRS